MAVQLPGSAGEEWVVPSSGAHNRGLRPPRVRRLECTSAGGTELRVARLDESFAAAGRRPSAVPAPAGPCRRQRSRRPATIITSPMSTTTVVLRRQHGLAGSCAAGFGGSLRVADDASFRELGSRAVETPLLLAPDTACGLVAGGFPAFGASRAACAKARKVLAEVAIVGRDDSAVALWACRELVGVPLDAAAAGDRAFAARLPATELVVRE